MGKSWREDASPEVQNQLDELAAAGLAAAETMLQKHGEFIPFAVVWKTGSDGAEMVMVVDDFEELPESPRVIEQTVATLREGRDGFDATGVVIDVRVDGQDAACIQLEHRTGITLAVFLPYRKKRFGRMDFGDVFAQGSDRQIWV